jgi:hypothetical protein
MDEFIEMLTKVESYTDLICNKADIIVDSREIVKTLQSLADELLINDTGGCNWKNIRILQSVGYSVFPLEKDSFGWVIGGIQTSRGIISYG